MSITVMIYLIEVLNGINELFFILFVIGLPIIGISSLIYASLISDHPDDPLLLNAIYILKKYWILIIVVVITILIPSKKSMYLMLGSKYISQSSVPTKVEKAITLKIDEYILDMEKTLKVNKE